MQTRSHLMFALIAASCIIVPDLAGQQIPHSAPNDYISDVISNVSDSAVAAVVRGLEAFGNRSWSNPNHDSVASWIRTRYLAAGVSDVAIDSFPYSSTWQKNVVATIPGTISPEKEIIVGGHYDGVSVSPGADDNASGTTATIEMARVLRAVNYVPRAPLRFIAFPAEEVGLLGSASYASSARSANRNIVLMQNYDMIGYRDITKPAREVYIVWYPGSETVARLDSSLKRLYTTLTPVLTTAYRSGSDSYSFYNQGYKTVFNIERNFSPVYHTPRDSSTLLDFHFAAEIIKSGLALLLTTDAAVTSADAPIAQVPRDFTLKQNYPNPFNPTTAISYELSAVSQVSLKVYDMVGREIATLVEDSRPAGVHTVVFDASGLASGVYVYRLSAVTTAQRDPFPNGDRDGTTGTFSSSKRMVLLK